MWLTDVSIRRPIFIIMFVLALIVMGYQSSTRMPAELNPKIEFPYVTVVTAYPGAGPSEIETLVSEPIEEAVGSIGNLRNVTSSSQDGVSIVVLEFELGTDLDAAAADVRDKVSSIKRNLPEDIEEPSIQKLDIASQPIMLIALKGPISPKEMRILADDVIKKRLQKVGGVASVTVVGGQEREISVAVDKERLQAYGVGIDKVATAIRTANLNVPAGSIKENTRDYTIRTVGEFASVKEIEDVRVYIPAKGTAPAFAIRIGDIATVKDTFAEPQQLSRLNGEPSVTLSIQKQSDANTVDVANRLKKELAEMRSVLPAGVTPVLARDDSVFVKDSLHDVRSALMEGIFLVVVIVFLFLHTARATFIVAVAIPTSIMATFIPISAFGFTLNTMTLLALALSVGILVDDSIVVLENIERHLRKREMPKEAALNGRSEIGLAAITITMVDIVVFVPIAFMGGIVGQFFRQFGVTVAVATAFSLFMSFTLTPMLASRWMKSEQDKEFDDEARRRRVQEGRTTYKDKLDELAGRLFRWVETFLSGLDSRYREVLEWALTNRFLTIVIGSVSLLVVLAMVVPKPAQSVSPNVAAKMMIPRVLIAIIALFLSITAMFCSRSRKIAIGFGIIMVFVALAIYLPFGFTMFPEVDQGQLTINIRTPPGTSLKATDKVVRECEKILREVPELKKGYYTSIVGAASSSFMGSEIGPQYGVIGVKCVDKTERKRSIRDIIDWIAARTALVEGAEKITVVAQEQRGAGSGVTKEVQGQNLADMIATAEKLAEVMRKTPGAVDVDISYKPNKPERRVVVDRLRAANLDMTVAQVAAAARMAIDGDDKAKLRDGGTEYPIRVRYANFDRSKASDVERLVIGSRDGAPIRLRDVAQVQYGYAPTKIDRKNRQRVIYVTCNLAKGAQMGNVNAAIDRAINKMQLPPGTTINTGGMSKIMIESFQYMGSALLLAVLLVYMLMGALFESFLTPFVIMFSLPQAMIGALLALLVTGNPMSIVAMIGIIMLMGLVTKNAILLVDYTNTLRGRGKSRHDALLEAGPTRLRPILMTTLAMIGGMMPTALAIARGAEMRSPMAIAVIGGLALSTLLTLIVIPVTYTLVDDAWQWIIRHISAGTGPKEGNPEKKELVGTEV